MRLADDEARRRLAASDHGVLGTTHRNRGADLVPVVFAVDGDHLAIPIDTVKPKAAGRLQRERNLAADPRASLLIEHWDAADWSRLWWVRACLRWLGEDVESVVAESLSTRLTTKYEAYAAAPFFRLLVFRIDDVSGWSGASSGR